MLDVGVRMFLATQAFIFGLGLLKLLFFLSLWSFQGHVEIEQGGMGSK